MSNCQPRDESRTGMVVVLVLVLVGLSAGLAAELLYLSRIRHRIKNTALESTRLRSALMDEAFQALQRLADDDDLQIDFPDEQWAQVVEYTTPDGVVVWSRIEDMNARFDVNNIYIEGYEQSHALQAVFMDFLTYFGDYTPVTKVEALRDWVDPDGDGGRESDWYLSQESEIQCSDYWLSSLAEICFVDGFSRDYMEEMRELPLAQKQYRLRDAITVLPVGRRSPAAINVNTASPLVLRAYAGMGNDVWVDYLLTARSEGPLSGLASFLSVVDAASAERLKPFLAVKSTFFLVRVNAFLHSRNETLQVIVQRDSTTGNIQILRWVLY